MRTYSENEQFSIYLRIKYHFLALTAHIFKKKVRGSLGRFIGKTFHVISYVGTSPGTAYVIYAVRYILRIIGLVN